jgi:hypothetical protein
MDGSDLRKVWAGGRIIARMKRVEGRPFADCLLGSNDVDVEVQEREQVENREPRLRPTPISLA